MITKCEMHSVFLSWVYYSLPCPSLHCPTCHASPTWPLATNTLDGGRSTRLLPSLPPRKTFQLTFTKLPPFRITHTHSAHIIRGRDAVVLRGRDAQNAGGHEWRSEVGKTIYRVLVRRHFPLDFVTWWTEHYEILTHHKCVCRWQKWHKSIFLVSTS